MTNPDTAMNVMAALLTNMGPCMNDLTAIQINLDAIMMSGAASRNVLSTRRNLSKRASTSRKCVRISSTSFVKSL